MADYSRGFGGKYGVQLDRQDKSAVGWDHHEAPQKHESQLDHKKGFGGKFGVQTDRVDKSASTYNEEPEKVGTNYTKVKPDIGDAKPSNLRAKFESLAKDKGGKAPQPNQPPVPKKIVHPKAAAFSNSPKEEDTVRPVKEVPVPKQLDSSKTAFLRNENDNQMKEEVEKTTPKALDQSKLAQFTQNPVEVETENNEKTKAEKVRVLY